MSTRRFSLTIGLFIALAGMSNLTLTAQPAKKTTAVQAPAKVAQTAKTPANDDGPVAVTPEVKRPTEKPVTEKPGVKGEFGNFGPAIINARGDVAFTGRYLRADNKYAQAYFIKKANGEWEYILEGTKGVNFKEPLISLGQVTINDNGDLTFTGTVDKDSPRLGVTGSEQNVAEGMKLAGLFTKTSAGIKSIAFIGEEIPNNPAKFMGFSNASMNTKGMMAFIGTYTDPDGRGLFIVEDGKFRLVARSGQRTPIADDVTYSEHFYPSTINERGEIAFYCRAGNGGAIFVRRPKGIEAIAIQDQASPTTGGNYIGFGNRAPAINNQGDVVFAGFFDGEKQGRGLFMHSNGKTKLIARSGDTLPDSRATFTDFMMPSVNSKGEVVFVATFAGRARGVFLATASGIEAIALYEKAVPGLERGERNIFNNFHSPSINENGDVIFYSQIRNNTVGLFIKKKGEELKPLAQTGDMSPVK